MGSRELHDVSLPISPALVHWPDDPPVEAERMRHGAVTISRWTLGSHAGTHVDAPVHFGAGPGTVSDIAPDTLIGPCRLLVLDDVGGITAAQLAGVDVGGMTRVLFRTRNSARWLRDTATFDPDVVALDASAAAWLIAQGVRLIGVDGLSVGDSGVHRMLLQADIVLLEGLALGTLPAGDYELLCAPLKLMGADGAPARVFLRR